MVGIYSSKLAEALKGPLPLVILLWGDDAGAIRQTADTVQQAIATRTGLALDDPFAVERLSLNDISAETSRLTDACLTLSFTSPHKLVVLRSVSGTERADDIKALTEGVKATLAHKPSGVTLLLPVAGHLDKKHALVKLIEGLDTPVGGGLSVRFFPDAARDLGSFLQAELTRHNTTATREALGALQAGLGADREIARREVEKLVAYAGADLLNGGPITYTHVQASLCGAMASGVFLLAEAVLAQDATKTDQLLHQLAEQGEDLNGALMLCLGELKKLALAQQLRTAGEADDAIIQQVSKAMLPPNAKAAFLQASRRYPAGRLAQVPERALEALTLARSGLLDGQHVLGRALLGWSI